MTTDPKLGRSEQGAVTYWELAEGTPKGEFSWLRVIIQAGVRHQIRCHLASIGHPIVGDVLYMTKGLKKRYHADTVRDSIELVSAGLQW